MSTVDSLYSKVVPHNFILGPVDTDSITFGKPDGTPFTKEEMDELLSEINNILPSKIRYADDGYFHRVVVLKAKNYCLWDGNKKKIKGSALRNLNKEVALREFSGKILDTLLAHGLDQDKIVSLYNEYVKEIAHLTDIKRWSSKKTVTEKILNPERTNEEKVLDALEESEQDFQEGDKIRVYFAIGGKLKLENMWNNDEDKIKLYEKLYKTAIIFQSVIPKDWFKNYKLKKNQEALCQMVGQ